MMRIQKRVLLFSFSFLSCGWSFAQEGQTEGSDSKEPPAEPEKAAPAAKDPEFKKESAKADFEKAKSNFEMGKFKEAEAIFKKVKADAKGKEDKDLVESWVQASAGGQHLERVKLEVKQNRLQQAYEETQVFLRKYKGTPVEANFQQLIDELAAQIFVPLENFDVPSAAYSEKFGKKFIDDPKISLDGTQCLEWTNTQDRNLPAELKIKRVPPDWGEFEAVEFWVKGKQAPPSLEAMIMSGEQASSKTKKKGAVKKKKDPEATNDCYHASFNISGQGWQRVRLRLADFKANGEASLSTVSDFRIQVDAGIRFDFYIDKIELVRKDPSAAGQRSAAQKGAAQKGTSKKGG